MQQQHKSDILSRQIELYFMGRSRFLLAFVSETSFSLAFGVVSLKYHLANLSLSTCIRVCLRTFVSKFEH